MAGAGERAYLYAKACGIIGKSFIGRRSAALRKISRLSELDRLVFGAQARELPERELLPSLEQRLAKRAVDSITSIVSCYSNPPRPLSLLVRVYEYSDLKTALAMVNESGAAKFSYTDLGRFATVHFDAWPDLYAMLKDSEFMFLLDKDGKLKSDFDGISLETALDRHYYRELWDSLLASEKKDCETARRITAEEISLRNCAWALRLRLYYGLKAREAETHLVYIDGYGEFCGDALRVLHLPLDSRSAWNGWGRERFLKADGVDPRFFQNAAAYYLYRLALHGFRRRPFSLDAAFCFIKIKQFEEDLLTSDAEGLGLGMSSADVFGILEAEF